jgi:hypothetical protein
MALTSKELARLARGCMKRAAEVPEPGKVEEDARAALQSLVESLRPRLRLVDVGEQARCRRIGLTHRDAIRALKRALAVDMQVPANRKGAILRALGLVGRVSKTRSVQHRAIALMMERLLELSEGITVPTFPYDSKRKAADAVAAGFFEAGINRRLTPENVEKIHARYWRTN